LAFLFGALLHLDCLLSNNYPSVSVSSKPATAILQWAVRQTLAGEGFARPAAVPMQRHCGVIANAVTKVRKGASNYAQA
jgi:hypothetical protein